VLGTRLKAAVWPWLATKGHAVALLHTGVRRRMERKRQNLLGWDEGSLTEQQIM